MAKKMIRCPSPSCRQWLRPSIKGKVPSHRVPAAQGNGTELCSGSGKDSSEKRGNW